MSHDSSHLTKLLWNMSYCVSYHWFHLLYRSFAIFYRCMCVKIVASLQRNPKCTTFIWKTTTLSVRHSTSSMTRGISSSQMQTLPACCFRSILKETNKKWNQQNKNKTRNQSGHTSEFCSKGHNIDNKIEYDCEVYK